MYIGGEWRRKTILADRQIYRGLDQCVKSIGRSINRWIVAKSGGLIENKNR